MTIPDGILERLPLELFCDDTNKMYSIIAVDAFELTETQGNIERGLRFDGIEE